MTVPVPTSIGSLAWDLLNERETVNMFVTGAGAQIPVGFSGYVFVSYDGPVALQVGVSAEGTELTIVDDGGFASSGNPITIQAGGGANISGASSVVISTAYGTAQLVSDGTNLRLVA